MTLDYSDEDVNKIEYARCITLSILRETEILLEEEKKINDSKTRRYKRLNDKLQSMKYVEELILRELRAIFY